MIEHLKRYAELKAVVAQAEAEMKKIQPVIIKEIQAKNIDKLETNIGNFQIQSKKTWKFSKKVDELEARLNDQVELEKQDGTATFMEVKYLKFYQPNPEENG